MELEDIILKQGDIIYTANGQKIEINGVDDGKNAKELQLMYLIDKITKIERPVKFETIYETQTQTLDDKEKEPYRTLTKMILNLQKEVYELKNKQKQISNDSPYESCIEKIEVKADEQL